MSTVRPILLPAPVKRVDWPVPLSLTQKGVAGSATRPQPFTRVGSSSVPPAPVSVTTSARVYCARAFDVKSGVSAIGAKEILSRCERAIWSSFRDEPCGKSLTRSSSSTSRAVPTIAAGSKRGCHGQVKTALPFLFRPSEGVLRCVLALPGNSRRSRFVMFNGRGPAVPHASSHSVFPRSGKVV